MKISYASMGIIDESKAVIQPIWGDVEHLNIGMLRLDLLHPIISGNKWYKLKENLKQVSASGKKSVLTFGGPFSNHLIATAAAARKYEIASIGIVRGLQINLTQTLIDCKAYGMELVFVSKEEYDKKKDAVWLQELSKRFEEPFIIPEGGANEWGRAGAEAIAGLIPSSYSHVCVSVGTGTTFIGLRNALPATQHLIGFAPMRGGDYLEEEIRQYLLPTKDTNWEIIDRWNFGGFGKWNDELISFMNQFYKTNDIPLDMVYTAKMMYGISKRLKQNIFPADAKILCVHTGGLQGNTSLRDKLVY